VQQMRPVQLEQSRPVKLEKLRPVKMEQLPRHFVALPPVQPPFDEEAEMPSDAGAFLKPPAGVFSEIDTPVAAAGDFPEASAGCAEGESAGADAAPEMAHCFRAAGSATIGMNSGAPADAAAPPWHPENRAVDPASSSSGSRDCCATGVLVGPAVAALGAFDQSARLATGCRSSKTGVCGVELSKSNRSCCTLCKAIIAKSAPRFLYWHSTKKPPGYIHTGCIVGLPLSAAELTENLSGLSPTEPILREAVVNAMAALAARAF
jgi:hypothetical protein